MVESGKWSKIENCKAEALRFSSRAEMHDHSRNCYDSIRKHGWDDLCFAHMGEKADFSTLRKCINEARKYESLKELSAGSQWLAYVIKKNGWEKKCYAHFEKKPFLRRYTKTYFAKLHKEYNSLEEVYENDPECFAHIFMRSLWNEVNESMPNRSRLSNDEIWDKIVAWIRLEALHYDSRSAFALGSTYARELAYKNGLMDDVCSHMVPGGNNRMRCIYSATFPDKCAYIGLTENYERRTEAHLNDVKSAVFKHTLSTGYKPVFSKIHDYIDVDEAQRLEALYVEEYKRAGWEMLNVAPAGGLGSNSSMSDEDIIEIARNYSTYTEFVKENRNLQQIASYRKTLRRKLRSMLPSVNAIPFTEESFWACVHSCKDYREFRFLHKGAYAIALKKGLLEKVKEILPPGTCPAKVESLEEAIELCADCKKMSELRYKSEKAYYLLRKNHISFDDAKLKKIHIFAH